MYPQVPLMETMGIGIALASYDGTLHWGFNSDPDIVPDADVFVEKVQAAYEAVAAAAGVEPKRAPALAAPAERDRARAGTGSRA
jgi:hypothetical protein